MMLDHRLVGPGFAAEVKGVDLSKPLDDASFRAVRDLWMKHKVLVFRGQSLDEDGMMQFTRPFGDLFVHVRSQFHSKAHKEVMILTNTVPYDDTRGAVGDNSELHWHTDQAYTAKPVWGTVLHSLEIPREGGSTWFADLAQAWEKLPPALKARAATLRTRFSIDGPKYTMHQEVPEEQKRASPDVVHPMLRKHPYLGHTILYVSPSHAMAIEGMDDDAAKPLLKELADWASQPDFVYAHKWQVGDVVMWDNTQTMHRRDPFPEGERRTLLRTGFYLPDTLAVPIAA